MAVTVLASKARRPLIIVAPRGTGKSEAMRLVHKAHDSAMYIDAVTQAGLGVFESKFSGFGGLIVLDDLGKLNTTYRRENTLSTLCELAYSGFVESHTGHHHLSIEGFKGSILMGCQPNVLAPVITSGTWDATIGDKTMRYYHLMRPLEPNLKPLVAEVDWGIELSHVKVPLVGTKEHAPLFAILESQWTTGRVYEHTAYLLRAAAAIDGSKVVRKADVKLVTDLLRPMAVEKYMVDRSGLGGEKVVKTEFYYLLMEFITYGTITAGLLVKNYKVSPATASRVLQKSKTMLRKVSTQPAVYAPSEELQAIINEVGPC